VTEEKSRGRKRRKQQNCIPKKQAKQRGLHIAFFPNSKSQSQVASGPFILTIVLHCREMDSESEMIVC
jgi:hypothetical protein